MTDWQKKRDEEAEELRVEADIGIRYPEAYLNGFKAGADWATRELLKHEAVVGLIEALEKYGSMKTAIKTVFGIEPVEWQLTPAGKALTAFEKFKKEIGE